MMRLLLSAVLVLAALPVSAGEGTFVYRPEPVSGPVSAGSDEGILVRTITLQRGDTLSRLSKRYAGKGYYYPQILLFNRIANPNLIYAGDTLRVPVGQPATAAVPAAAAVSDARQEPLRGKPASPAAATSPTGRKNSEQQLFERGMSRFRTGRYRAALDLFDRFLREYPDSPRSADATFYRGECYLNLSLR